VQPAEVLHVSCLQARNSVCRPYQWIIVLVRQTKQLHQQGRSQLRGRQHGQSCNVHQQVLSPASGNVLQALAARLQGADAPWGLLHDSSAMSSRPMSLLAQNAPTLVVSCAVGTVISQARKAGKERGVWHCTLSDALPPCGPRAEPCLLLLCVLPGLQGRWRFCLQQLVWHHPALRWAAQCEECTLAHNCRPTTPVAYTQWAYARLGTLCARPSTDRTSSSSSSRKAGSCQLVNPTAACLSASPSRPMHPSCRVTVLCTYIA